MLLLHLFFIPSIACMRLACLFFLAVVARITRLAYSIQTCSVDRMTFGGVGTMARFTTVATVITGRVCCKVVLI